MVHMYVHHSNNHAERAVSEIVHPCPRPNHLHWFLYPPNSSLILLKQLSETFQRAGVVFSVRSGITNVRIPCPPLVIKTKERSTSRQQHQASIGGYGALGIQTTITMKWKRQEKPLIVNAVRILMLSATLYAKATSNKPQQGLYP